MSIGLASLLRGEEGVAQGKALLARAAATVHRGPGRAASGARSLTAGTPADRLAPPPSHSPFIGSQSLSDLSSFSARSRHIPGSRSLEQVMQEMEKSRSQEQTTTTRSSPGHGDSKVKVVPGVPGAMFQPGMTGHGLLQTLKAKGYSLYGLWGGGQGASTDPIDPSDPSLDPSQASGVDGAPGITRGESPEKYEATLARVIGRRAATDTDT